jgi:hypothetical protein
VIDIAHLTREDLRSLTWDRLIQDMQARRDALRVENDSFSDHDTTTKRRGRIAELKEWLDLAEQAQRSEASSQDLAATLSRQRDDFS